MSEPVRIYVTPTNNAGGVWIDVLADESTQVSVYTAAYTPNAEGAAWTLLNTITAPSKIQATLPIGVMSLVMVAGIIEGSVFMSPASVVLPTHYEGSYSIDIDREPMGVYEEDGESLYRLKMQAVNPKSMSEKIFLYEKMPDGSVSQTNRDNFVSICKPGDLLTYPEDEPLEEQVPPFFRKDTLDLAFPNILELEAYVDSILFDINSLVLSLESNEYLVYDDVYVMQSDRYTQYPEWSSSSSSSSYSSSSSSWSSSSYSSSSYSSSSSSFSSGSGSYSSSSSNSSSSSSSS